MAEDKLLVSVTLGVTLPVTEFGNIRPSITIANLDPSADVSEQIKSGIETGVKAMVEIDKNLDVIISQILAPETGKPGFKDRLADVEQYVAITKKNFKNLQVKLKENSALIQALEAKVGINGSGVEKES